MPRPLAEIEERWANLRAGPKALTEREAHHLATVFHDRCLQQHTDNPSQQTAWKVDLADCLFAPPRRLKSFDITDPDFDVDPNRQQILEMEKWCLEGADEYLATLGLLVEAQSRGIFAKAIAAAVQRASLTLARLATGEAPTSGFLLVQGGAAPTTQQPLPLTDLVKGWAAERRPAAKTLYEWSRVVRQLVDYLGHSDARRLTSEDLIGWKQSMVPVHYREPGVASRNAPSCRAGSCARCLPIPKPS